MCTVTFIPRENGFLIGMNRDERWERGRRSLPPEIRAESIYPRDAKGGTWIAVNSSALAFAILNRNGDTFTKSRSRGDVIPDLVSCHRVDEAVSCLQGLDLVGTLPFTLLIFSARAKHVSEYVWSGKELASTSFPWRARHWFSSGLSDLKAAHHRSELVTATTDEIDYGSSEWMRRLHRLHGETPGPFSICVHREEVGSVSYTEVDVDATQITMTYWAGSPCVNQVLPGTSQALPFFGNKLL